jgi:exonuclease III
MILMLLNLRGLDNLSKKQSLHSLVELHKLDTLLMQETKCDGKKCVSGLAKILEDWDFYYMDSIGHSGGLISTKRTLIFLLTSSPLIQV